MISVDTIRILCIPKAALAGIKKLAFWMKGFVPKDSPEKNNSLDSKVKLSFKSIQTFVPYVIPVAKVTFKLLVIPWDKFTDVAVWSKYITSPVGKFWVPTWTFEIPAPSLLVGTEVQ